MKHLFKILAMAYAFTINSSCSNKGEDPKPSNSSNTNPNTNNTPAPTTGSASFWTNSDLGHGYINVYLNNMFIDTMTIYYKNGLINCANAEVQARRDSGLYNWYAVAVDGTTWKGNINIIKGNCFNIELSNANISSLKTSGGSNDGEGIVLDADGNSYPTVKIGSQVWMAQNLRTTKYNDYTNIQVSSSNGVSWDTNVYNKLTIPIMGWYQFKNSQTTYGALYNWYTVTTNKLCPIGWHVPSDSEWTALSEYIGKDVSGTKLKSTSSWQSNPYETGTDNYGFNALPAGYYNNNNSFSKYGSFGVWWSSTEYNATNGVSRDMGWNLSQAPSNNFDKAAALSIRCIKN